MIYLAGPFFNEEELTVIQRAEQILLERGFDIYSPRLHEDPEHEFQSPQWSAETFRMDRDAIDESRLVVMIYHGNYSDTGTAWECGYAYAKGKPVVAVQVGESSNLMVHESAIANIRLEDLADYDFDTLEEVRYEGIMF